MTEELHSVRGLAWRLGIPVAELREIAADTEAFYRPFPKKRPGRPDRIIDNPLLRLKHVQRRVRAALLERLPLDDSVYGGVKGRSARDNANVHCGQRNLASVDIKNCFPSVTNDMVFRLLREAGLGPRVASLLTVLMTRKGHVPQGAPSSDRLANLVLAPIDQKAHQIATALGLRRGRFIDDFALSGDRTHEAIGQLIAALRSAGFAVGHRKTGNAGAHKAHVTTGYTATPYGLKVSRQKRQQIRTRVVEMVRAHLRGESTAHLRASVVGSLNYLRPTNAGLVRRLEKQLGDAGVPLA